MLDLPILYPVVFQELIEKFTQKPEHVLLNRFPQEDYPFQTARWDVLKGSRTVSRPNVPNAEAHIVPRLGRSAQIAEWMYLRDKKTFSPTTTMWMKEAGPSNNTERVEAAIAREVKDLSDRMDNFAELCIWAAMSGQIRAEYSDNVWEVNYNFPASHTPTPAVGWDVATPDMFIANIEAWKRTIRRDSGNNANEVFAGENVMRYVWSAFAGVNQGTGNNNTQFLSEEMKNSYFRDGSFGNFLGLNWNTITTVYQNEDGNDVEFVPDNAFYMGDYTTGEPIKTYIGPTADFDAPQGSTGKFGKSWNEPDPSAQVYMIEWSFLPIVRSPESLLFVADVTA